MFDVEHIILSGGLLIVGLIVFSESGLLVGFFLPGDSLLIAAGFLAGQGHLPIAALVATVVIAAIVGYEVGYEIGKKAGPRVFTRKEGVLFKAEYVERANDFFEKYGAATIVLARFVPIVRTVVSTVAGVGSMDRRKYTTYNIIGALLWGAGLCLLGYWLGGLIPDFDKFLVPAVILATVGSFAFAFWHVAKNAETRRQLRIELKEELGSLFRRKGSRK